MELLVAIVIWIVCWFAPLALFVLGAYGLISIPLRKRERIRAFLMLLDAGLKDGRRVEDTIVSLAATRDPGLGSRFRAIATSMSSGKLRLSQALESSPGFVPDQIVAMLKVGERLGDIGKVLPACKHLMKDTLTVTRSSIQYLLVTAFVTTPVAIFILTVLQIFVIPQFVAVVSGMGVGNPPGLSFLAAHGTGILGFESLILITVWLTSSLYIGTPPLWAWFHKAFPMAHDRILLGLPWRRKRLQRDFSSMLALLLDAGVPEPEAITLAAQCTSNSFLIRRAQVAVTALQSGRTLSEAVQLMDDTGEFRWRLANAVHAHGGFFKAIHGWNESLDAKAFQQEQTTAQVIASGLVVINGIFIGFVVVSLFSVLIAIINEGTLW